MKKLSEIAKKALAEPYHMFLTVVDGFSLGVFWDTERGWFECCMLYSPSYSGKTYIYGDSVESLIGFVKKQITEDKKIYKDGGMFPENYYER